jgi:tRNA A-37 threonylcarbamoyl transferase component Bud32
LQQLQASGYVPWSAQVDIETIRTLHIESQPVTDAKAFMAHYVLVLNALRVVGIRHGDLTEKNVIANRNKPYLIDFAESRLWGDPRPDKRREGDAYWLWKTMNKLSTE